MRTHINIKSLILISLVFVACSKQPAEEKKSEATQIHPEYVEKTQTAVAKLMPIQEELLLTGKVEYNPDKLVNYTPLISGVVEKASFSLGDKVSKGQTLVVIRSADLSQMFTESKASEAQVKIAKREYQSAKALFADNMLSEKELYQAESEMNNAIAQQMKLKNDLSAYTANSDGTFSIKAPLSGYVVEKNVSVGSMISPDNGILFSVADLSQVWIVANVYAGDLQFVHEGMKVKITTLSYPGEIFEGKIDRLSQVFDSEDNVLKARIYMDNKNMKFKPEMSVVVRLHNENKAQLIGIPNDALIFDNDEYYVVIKKEDNSYETRKVLLSGHLDKITYLNSGLSENEVVLTKNQLLIYNELNQK